MFVNGSLLRLLVLTSCPDLPTTFTILDLSLALKRLILDGSWYDPNNPHMIMWPEEYQHVLERAISDVGDLHGLLRHHLVDDPDPMAQSIDIMPKNQKFVVKVTGIISARSPSLEIAMIGTWWPPGYATYYHWTRIVRDAA
jgi:hypothetical protein